MVIEIILAFETSDAIGPWSLKFQCQSHKGLGNFKYHWTSVISDTIGLLLFLLLCFLCQIDVILAILYFSKILFLFLCVILLSQNVAAFMCRILFVFATTVKILHQNSYFCKFH